MLGDWSPEDISSFHEGTTARMIPWIITKDAGATGSIAYATRPAYMLPSVDMVTELNEVDVAAVRIMAEKSRDILRHRPKTNPM